MKSSRMSPNKRDSVICNVRYQPNNLGSRGFPAVFSKKTPDNSYVDFNSRKI
jgi:hypothetical protein